LYLAIIIQKRYLHNSTKRIKMRKSIDEKVQIFTKDLEDVKRLRSVPKFCRIELKKLTKKYTLATTRHYLTSYRKAIKNMVGMDEKRQKLILESLKLTKEQNKQIDDSVQVGVVSRNSNLKPINNPKKMIAMAVGLLNESSYYKRTLGLALLTGRRCGEILKTAKFTAHKGRKYEVNFFGQLKRHNDDGSGYMIPILAESKLIRSTLKGLRKDKDFSKLTISQINSKTSKDLGAYCKKIFAEFLGDDVNPHSLRKAYSTIAIRKFCPPYISPNKYTSSILGHNEDDLNTANSYNKYYIEDF